MIKKTIKHLNAVLIGWLEASVVELPIPMLRLRRIPVGSPPPMLCLREPPLRFDASLCLGLFLPP